MSQHVLIALAAVLRVAVLLLSKAIRAEALVFLGGLTYLAEYVMYTYVVSSWAKVAHFSMRQAELRSCAARARGASILGGTEERSCARRVLCCCPWVLPSASLSALQEREGINESLEMASLDDAKLEGMAGEMGGSWQKATV